MSNMELIQSALGGKLCQCQSCKKIFVNYEMYRQVERKFCATCNAIRKQKSSIVLDRGVKSIIDAVTIDESFPLDGWEVVKTKDGIRYKLDRRGGCPGERNNKWQIVIWSRNPVAHGDVVRIRHMKAQHRRAKDGVEEERTYFVIIPTNKLPTGEMLVWDRSDEYPLRIRQPEILGWTDEEAEAYAAQLDEYSGPSTLARLQAVEDED